MGGLVLEYETDTGETYPNIHGNRFHYHGGLIAQRYTGKEFSKIKDRYLATIITATQGEQTSPQEREYIQTMLEMSQGRGAAMEAFEEEIEQQLMVYCNNLLDDKIIDSYKSASASVTDAFKQMQNKQKKAGTAVGHNAVAYQNALGALDNLFTIMTTYQDGASLFLAIKNSNSKVATDLKTLMGYTSLKRTLDKLAAGTYTKVKDGQAVAKDLSKGLIPLLAQPSEFYVALLEVMADHAVAKDGLKAINSALKTVLSGRKQTYVNLTSNDIKVQSKSVDITGATQTVHVHNRFQVDETIKETHEITVTPRGSVKAYRSEKGSQIGMVQSKAILLDLIHEVYKSHNSALLDYQVCNSLAFNSKDSRTTASAVLDRNFRIIRSDITAAYAEKFIAGLAPEQMQQIFIYNFKAYPMLYVINGVIEDAMREDANLQYGSVETGNDLFTVSFHTVGNEWDPVSKSNRIKKVYNDIKNIVAQGKFNGAKLQEYLGKMPGLSI